MRVRAKGGRGGGKRGARGAGTLMRGLRLLQASCEQFTKVNADREFFVRPAAQNGK